mgnify:CR=1 FL=1
MRHMLTILISLAFLSAPSFVVAQQIDTQLDAGERVILVTREHCQLLNSHVPDDDVAYKADEDVRGNALVPAEIKSGNSLLDSENGYSFYMTYDALKDSPLNPEAGLDGANEGKIILGQVTVKDGDVLWNGISLKTEDRDQIYMLCDEQRKRRPIIKR